MTNQDVFKALVDVVDVVVEYNNKPLTLGDIKFEILKNTGKINISQPVHKWTTADAVLILEDLRSYLMKELDLVDKS